MDMLLQQRVLISIHAAREGGDCIAGCPRNRNALFQSTPPVKAATEGEVNLYGKAAISIHAAREGGDACAGSRG